MTEFERGLGQRWFELVWNQRRREAIAQMLSPDAVLHEGNVDTLGADAFYPFFDRINQTFSDINVHIDDALADGDKVCVRWTFTGNHTGDGLGFAATGVKVHITGISIIRVTGDRIVEGWQNWDMLGMLEQIKGGGRAATYVG
jgi:steroid delta-isomerase-like uncharacterized protein